MEDGKGHTKINMERTEGCWADLGQGEPKTEGTEGCWADMGHSGKDQDRGNW